MTQPDPRTARPAPPKPTAKPAPAPAADPASALRGFLARSSRTQLGALLVASACVLSVLPFFATLGRFWTPVMLTGSGLVFARESRAAGRPLWPVLEQLPPVVWHPLVPLLFTFLTFGCALIHLNIGLTPLFWLAASWLLGSEQVLRRLPRKEGSSWPVLPPRKRLLPVVAALGVCTLGFFLPWWKFGGTYRGAIESRYVSENPDLLVDVPYAGRWRNDYNALAYYVPTFTGSGRNQPVSVLSASALLLLAALLLWELKQLSARPSLPLWLAGGLTLWCLFLVTGTGVGRWLFLAGAVTLDVLAVLHYQERKAAQPSVPPAPSA